MIRISVPKLDLLCWLLSAARAPLPLDLLNVLEKLEAKHWLLKGGAGLIIRVLASNFSVYHRPLRGRRWNQCSGCGECWLGCDFTKKVICCYA